MLLKSKGLLVSCCVDVGDKETSANTEYQAKPTHENIIRLAPPLIISEEEINDTLRIIKEALTELPSLKGKREDEVIPQSEKGVKIHLDD